MNNLSLFGIIFTIGITTFFVGIGVFLDVKGPAQPIPIPADPTQAIGGQCIPPPPAKPSGFKITVVNAQGQTVESWDFQCGTDPESNSIVAAITKINKDYCVDNKANVNSHTENGVTADPFTDTNTGDKGIRLNGPNGNFMFPCKGNWANELQHAMEQMFSGCCL